MGYVAIIIAIFFVELLIKNKIEEQKENFQKPILGGKVLLEKYHNSGALLNLLEKKRKVVAGISLFFSLLMIVYFVCTLTTRGNHMLKLGLSFLLGGAFSNTYDRMKRKYVVDYMSFSFGPPRIRNVVYNIADFFIMIGSLLFVISQL